MAQAIGNKIYTISQKSQVLCITHLPQVAAMSDHHYFIEKQISDNRVIDAQTVLADRCIALAKEKRGQNK